MSDFPKICVRFTIGVRGNVATADVVELGPAGASGGVRQMILSQLSTSQNSDYHQPPTFPSNGAINQLWSFEVRTIASPRAELLLQLLQKAACVTIVTILYSTTDWLRKLMLKITN